MRELYCAAAGYLYVSLRLAFYFGGARNGLVSAEGRARRFFPDAAGSHVHVSACRCFSYISMFVLGVICIVCCIVSWICILLRLTHSGLGPL